MLFDRHDDRSLQSFHSRSTTNSDFSTDFSVIPHSKSSTKPRHLRDRSYKNRMRINREVSFNKYKEAISGRFRTFPMAIFID